MNLHFHPSQAERIPYPPFPDSKTMEYDEAMSHIADAVLTINEAVNRAVSSGMTVELVRTSRCHDGCGNWGDQVSLVLREGKSV
jgi:hypothetical protein